MCIKYWYGKIPFKRYLSMGPSNIFSRIVILGALFVGPVALGGVFWADLGRSKSCD